VGTVGARITYVPTNRCEGKRNFPAHPQERSVAVAPTAILREARVRTTVPLLLLFLVSFVLMTSHASAYYDGLPAKQFQPDDPVAEGDPDLPSGFTDSGQHDLGVDLAEQFRVLVGVLLSSGLLGR
jgi:hypothetical protein